MKINSKKLEKSQIEIEFELTPEEFQEHFNHALEHLKHHVKVDGFREGKAPASMVEEKIKPEVLLMEAGDHAVHHVYTNYVRENNLELIGQPEVSIIKIAKGNPFIFKAKITVLPDVELPDYKEIVKKVRKSFDAAQGGEISVTDQEVQDALNYLQKTKAKFTLKNDVAQKGDFVEIEYYSPQLDQGKAAPQSGASLAPKGREAKDRFILGEGGMIKDFEENVVGMKAGEEKEFSVKFPENSVRKDLAGKDIVFKVKMVSVQKMELPEINDEFAKQLESLPAGRQAFDTLVALKASMKEGMTIEKKEEAKQKNRGEILEKIVEKSKIEVPETMVKYEQERLFEDLKNKITQTSKATFEEYLSTIKQTEEQIKETYQKEAEKRIRKFLVLREIGKKENIEVTDAEVEEEVIKSIKNYSKEDLAKIDINQLKEYTKGVIINEKIFKKLEECQ